MKRCLAIFLIALMAVSIVSTAGVVMTAMAAPATDTFTVTDEQGHVLQQTSPTKGDRNAEPAHDTVAASGGPAAVSAPTQTSAVAAAIPAVQWHRSYGGSNDEVASSVRQTSDGGYILAGSTTSYGNSRQAYLVKTNATGVQKWSRAYGGSGYDYAREIQQTKDGGYIMVGTYQSGSDQQLWLRKLNSTGQLNTAQGNWGKTYGGTGAEYGYSVQQTSDGGYIAVGSTSVTNHGTDVYFLKVDAKGTAQWHKTFGGVKIDVGYCVRQTSDGGYIICGYSNSWTSDGNNNGYLIKTDKNGNVGSAYPGTWSHTYGRARDDTFEQLVTTTDGYAVVGSSNSFTAPNNNYNLWLEKVWANGTEQWHRMIGGASNTWENTGCSIAKTSSGGYITTGYTADGSSTYIFTIKTDAYGRFGSSYPGTWGRQDGAGNAGYSVVQTTDGGYAIAGGGTSMGANQAVLYKIAPG